MSVRDVFKLLLKKGGEIMMSGAIGKTDRIPNVVSQNMFNGFGAILKSLLRDKKLPLPLPLRYYWTTTVNTKHFFAVKYSKATDYSITIEAYIDTYRVGVSTLNPTSGHPKIEVSDMNKAQFTQNINVEVNF